MSPRKFTPTELLLQGEPPMNWSRAFISGMIGAALMMAFIDAFNMMQLTGFSFELYLGSLLLGNPYGTHAWTLGFFANLLVGGLFGVFYAYCFEYVFKAASPRLGILVGLGHAAIAAFAVFPFLHILHEETRTGLYPRFGILGSGIDLAAPPILVVAHMLFGAAMGTFYGPVRLERVRMNFAEPGETGPEGAWYVITEEEDPLDRASSFKGSA